MGQRPGDRVVHRVRPAPEVRRSNPVRRIRDAAMLDSEERVTPALVRYGVTVIALALLTAALLPVHEAIGLFNIGLMYLVVVIGATTFGGRGPGILASVLGFALVDFFLVRPYFTFAITQLEDLFALFVFLGVSALISWLLARAREQARQEQQHAEDLARLYELSQAIIGAQHPDEVLPKIAGKVAEVFEANACWILLPDSQQQLAVRSQAPEGARPPARAELGMAQWAFEHGSEVGQGSVTPPQFQEQQVSRVTAFVPLRAANRTIGVLAVADKKNGRPFTAAERTILATFADQAAVALERLRLLREADRAEMLDRADKLKSALMSAVSHDLRTPLASIMASVTSLLEPDIEWSKETQQDFLQGIYDEARRLNVVVGNLLDMSRIEGGALRPEKDWYSIAEVIEAVAQRLEPNLAGHPLSINVEEGLPLTLLDFSEIDQVLTNLVENAIKYTPPGAPISVAARQAGDNIEVRVADGGPGVPSEHLPYLFDKFYRVDGRKPGTGIGLGLAISKGLIEAHGGTIWAGNLPGGGLEVVFTLPLPSMRDLHVLIVDDEPAIARALRPALEGHGFAVATASSGAQAIAQVEAADEMPLDLILLDLGLPDMDGVDLTAELRKLTDAPIIVLSVRGADRDKIAALDNGADDYLTKPFSIGELMARVRVVLRRVGQAAPASAAPQPIAIGGIVLDAQRHAVTVNGSPVHLSPTEFQLLETLMQSAGKLVTHRTLLYKVWGPEYAADTQLLRVYIGQLRGKIEDRAERPTYIVTEPGIGYRFRDSQ